MSSKDDTSFFKEHQALIGISLCLITTIGLVTYTLTILPKNLNDEIDWNKIDQQVRTNQTLTNSWSCDNIQFFYDEANRLIITPHPEIVKDFHDLGLKRGCSFAENTK